MTDQQIYIVQRTGNSKELTDDELFTTFFLKLFPMIEQNTLPQIAIFTVDNVPVWFSIKNFHPRRAALSAKC